MERNILGENIRNIIKSEIKSKNFPILDFNKNEIIEVWKNVEDSDNLLEENCFSNKKSLNPNILSINKLEKNLSKQDHVNYLELHDEDLSSLLKLKNKNITSSKGKITRILLNDILGTPPNLSKNNESEIINKEKQIMVNKLYCELSLFDKRKLTYKKEAPKKKENSLDKSFKNIAFLTKADNTLINFYINKIKLFSTFIFLFVLTNLTLNVVDLYMFSLDFFNNLDSLCHPDEKRIFTNQKLEEIINRGISPTLFSVRILNYCVVLVIIMFVIFLYQVELEILKYYMRCEKDASLISQQNFKSLILEICILSIFFVPDFIIVTNYIGLKYLYPVNAFFCLLSTVKIYVISNWIFHISKWRKCSNIVICHKYQVLPNLHFVNIAMFKQHLIIANLIIFLFSAIYYGFLLHSFNLGVFLEEEDKNIFTEVRYDIFISIYMIIETCLTLGYGEYPDSSYVGKFVTISSVFWGWVCLSLIIVFAFRKMDFDEDEKKSYYAFKTSEFKEIARQNAIKVIKLTLRLNMLKLRDSQCKFLHNYENYNILKFLNKESELNSSNHLNKIFCYGHIKQKSIRFYNKIFSFFLLKELCRDFKKSVRILDCHLPSSDVLMNSFMSKIDDSYVKINKFIDLIQEGGNEFKRQLNQSENTIKRLIRIKTLQSKIGNYFLKKNNLRIMKKYGRTLVLDPSRVLNLDFK